MDKKKILLLGGRDESTRMVFNSLNKKFGIDLAIIEAGESKKLFLKRRVKKLGIITVIGQIFFQLFVVKFLRMVSEGRRNELLAAGNLDLTEIPADKIRSVQSVNAEATIEMIKDLNPDLIIVNGTRIISKKVLASVSCKFINMHSGITPKYRGVHGAYWSLVLNDVKNCGITVHFVDAGIDTGNIIEQGRVVPDKKDNFTTYPLLQLSAGLKLQQKAVEDYFSDQIIPKKGTEESSLWVHPTIWAYFYYRFFRGVK